MVIMVRAVVVTTIPSFQLFDLLIQPLVLLLKLLEHLLEFILGLLVICFSSWIEVKIRVMLRVIGCAYGGGLFGINHCKLGKIYTA